jgi:hypothetical protein
MVAAVTILSAFALGYFMRSRLAACTTYAIAYLWAFTFQTLYLVLDMLSSGKTLNTDDPAFVPDEFPWQYGAVTLSIFVVGFGLVNLGHRVRQRRQARARSSLTGTSASAASGNAAASANVAG